VRLTGGVDRLCEYLNVCVGVLGCETDRGVDRMYEYLNVCGSVRLTGVWTDCVNI